MNGIICIGDLVRFKDSWEVTNGLDVPWFGLVISVIGDRVAIYWATGQLWCHDIESIATA